MVGVRMRMTYAFVCSTSLAIFVTVQFFLIRSKNGTLIRQKEQLQSNVQMASAVMDELKADLEKCKDKLEKGDKAAKEQESNLQRERKSAQDIIEEAERGKAAAISALKVDAAKNMELIREEKEKIRLEAYNLGEEVKQLKAHKADLEGKLTACQKGA